MSGPSNVLFLALVGLRAQFLRLVWATVLCTAGWTLLALTSWQVALGIALLCYGFAARGRAMAGGQGGGL